MLSCARIVIFVNTCPAPRRRLIEGMPSHPGVVMDSDERTWRFGRGLRGRCAYTTLVDEGQEREPATHRSQAASQAIGPSHAETP